MILIIGYGNDLRKDDGAGLVLAKIAEQACLQRQIPAERINVQLLLPELAPRIASSNVDAVIFTDTRVLAPNDPQPCIEIQPVEINNQSTSVGHQLEPAVLLTYARLLYGRQPPAYLVTVPGIDFDHGFGLSPLTQQTLAQAGNKIAALINDLTQQIYGGSALP